MTKTTFILVLAMLLGSGLMIFSCHNEAHATPDAVVKPTPDENPKTDHAPQDIARNVYDSVRAGRWIAAVGGVLMLLVWGFRKLGLKSRVKWFGTAFGGRVLLFGLATLTTLGTAWMASEPPSLSLFAGALAAAWAAAGQWEDVKDVKAEAKRRAPTGPMGGHDAL